MLIQTAPVKQNSRIARRRRPGMGDVFTDIITTIPGMTSEAAALSQQEASSALSSFSSYIAQCQAIYQSHFQDYQAKAPYLSASDRTMIATALNDESSALADLQSLLWTGQQRYQQVFGSSPGLGAFPFLAVAVLSVLALLAGTAIYVAYTHMQNSQGDVAQKLANASLLTAVTQRIAAGTATATDYALAGGSQVNTALSLGGDALTTGLVIGAVGLGLFLILR